VLEQIAVCVPKSTCTSYYRYRYRTIFHFPPKMRYRFLPLLSDFPSQSFSVCYHFTTNIFFGQKPQNIFIIFLIAYWSKMV